MTPLEVIKCYLFKTNQYVRVCIFSLKIDNISWTKRDRNNPQKNINDLDEVFSYFFLRLSIRLQVRSSFISIVGVIKTRKPQLIPCQE